MHAGNTPAHAREGLRTPSRRSVVRAAAWTVPAVTVAVAAPAYAASATPQPGCSTVNGTLDWDGAGVSFVRSSPTRAAATLTQTGADPLTVTVAASYVGDVVSGNEFGGLDENLTRAASVGGLDRSGLRLLQSTTARDASVDHRGVYTFTFSRPVSNLQFTLTDIDSALEDFWDVVQPSPGYAVMSKGRNVVSDENGLSGQRRFYYAGNNTAVNDVTSSSGNLALMYGGQVSTFSLTYWNGAGQLDRRIDSNQNIFISDMSFTYASC